MYTVRKILSIFLSFVILFSVSAAETSFVCAEETDGQQGVWTYDTYEYDGTSGVVITGYNGSATDIYVPSSIESGETQLPVLKLGDGVFQNNTAVNSVTLGNGIKIIGDNAFCGAVGLVCIVTDEELAEIGANAFGGCTNFNSVILYDGIKSIGENAFAGCENLTIYCNEGTVGYEYAKNNGIDVEILNPDAIPETVTEDGVTYYILNGEALLMNCEDSDRVVVKPYINGNPVTTVNANFMQKQDNKLTEIYLPDTIKIIPEDTVFSASTVLFCSRESVSYTFAEKHNILHIAMEYGNYPQLIKDGNFTYYAINNEYALLKECDKSISGTVSVPEKMNSLPVTGIFAYAFKGCESLTQVILPETATNIYPYAFDYCHKLESINIPDGTETIGTAAFEYCDSLKNITIPKSVRRIEASAFRGTGLETVDLPQKIEFIGSEAFCYTHLSEVTLPSNAVIGNDAFGSTNISKVYVPAETENVWFNAFFGYQSNTQKIVFYVYADSPAQKSCEENHMTYYVVDGGGAEPYEYQDDVSYYNDEGEFISYYANYLICNNEAILLSAYGSEIYDIPEYVNGIPVTVVSRDAFSLDGSIVKRISLPESIKYIEKEAFRDCELLEEINIPSGVSAIEENTFYGCRNLKNIVLPDSLKEIGDYAFAHCGIENITFPESLVKIGREAFENSGLTKLDYPVADMGIRAFGECKNLSEVNIPSGVTVLPERVFEGCEQLKFLYIPDSIADFGDYVFFGCSRLIMITESDSLESPAVQYAKKYGIMFSTEYWLSFVKTYEYTYEGINYYLVYNGWGTNIYSAVVLPGNYKFTGNVTIPETIRTEFGNFTVSKIGDLAFDGTDITGIELPESINIIGDLAFRGCKFLSEINIPDNVKIIGATAFSGSGLNGTLIYPECKVGKAAFATTNYDTVYVPEGVTVLPEYVFLFAKKLEKITLPESLQKIENLAFSNVPIKNLVIPGNTVIDKNAFVGLYKLEKLVLSEGITRLEENFCSCQELKLVYLPKSLTYIDYNSFSDCPNAVFCVYENSYAHMFAKKKGLPYFILGTKNNPNIAYGTEISGTATYTDGTPVPNAAADIIYDDGTLKENVTTDENGAYKFTYAEVGRYTIRITDSEGRTGSEQISVKRKNAFDVFLAGTTNITVKNSWSISGTVTPQGNASVTLTDTDGNIITSVQTENGKYMIDGVPNGSYIIKAENENGSAVKEITVFNAAVTDADISIEQQSASIEGYVEVEDRKQKRDKRRWAQITICNSDGVAVASGKTDDNGKYSFSNLPFGSYSIVAEVAEMRPEHNKDYKRTFTLRGYARITLSEAKLYTVDTIILTEENDSTTIISGKVTAHGENQSGQVILTDIFRNEISRCAVGKNGKYTFSNVRDGLYFIVAVTENNGMGFTAVVVRHGKVYGDTSITVYKEQKIIEHEENMNKIPDCANRDEALKHRDSIANEKAFYDGLPEKEKKQFSHEYTERLNKLSEYISSFECNANDGELSQGGMIISADELNNGESVQFELNVEKCSPWTIGDGGINTDEEFMQQSIEDAKGSKTAAQYYDITLSKNIGGEEKQITDVKKDTDTTGKVRVTIPIPEEYKGHKKYSFVHMHNGIATTLIDLDDNPDTVTFEIDKFSTFVLTYSDEEEQSEYPAKISYADGKITVSSSEDADVYIADYKDGKLISLKKYGLEANSVQSFDFGETNEAFVWDKVLRPLTETKYKLEKTAEN